MILMIRYVLAFSLITLLLFSHESLPTSAAADGEGEGGVQPVKDAAGGEKVADHGDIDDELSSISLPKKLGVHMRKVRSGGGGIATRARGRTSSAVPTQLSSFHFGSLLGCSLFLGLIML